MKIIATGGVRDGLDIARAIALGAAAGGIARTFLQAWNRDGRRGALSAAREVLDEVRIAHLLCGARTPSDLASTPLHVGNNLARWIPSDSPLRARFTDA